MDSHLPDMLMDVSFTNTPKHIPDTFPTTKNILQSKRSSTLTVNPLRLGQTRSADTRMIISNKYSQPKPMKLELCALSHPIAVHTTNNPIELKNDDPSETLLTHSKHIIRSNRSKRNTTQLCRETLKHDDQLFAHSLRESIKIFANSLKHKLNSNSNRNSISRRHRNKTKSIHESNDKTNELASILEKIGESKKVNIDSFIDCVRETVETLVKLNYQSIERFTQTKVMLCIYVIYGCNIMIYNINI